jgi:hypothetical protein
MLLSFLCAEMAGEPEKGQKHRPLPVFPAGGIFCSTFFFGAGL